MDIEHAQPARHYAPTATSAAASTAAVTTTAMVTTSSCGGCLTFEACCKVISSNDANAVARLPVVVTPAPGSHHTDVAHWFAGYKSKVRRHSGISRDMVFGMWAHLACPHARHCSRW